MKVTGRLLAPLIFTFILFSIVFLVLRLQLENFHCNTVVLHAGNAILLLIGILSVFIQVKGLNNSNPHAFIRSVTSGMMIKMIICVIAVFSYVYFSGSDYNKRSIFILLFMYLVYLAVEVSALMKLNKNSKADA